MNRMNYDEFAPMFGKWATKFKPFIESEEFYNIYQQLKKDSLKGERILPDSDKTFRVFELTDPEKVKTVWYVMDPYCRLYSNKVPQATGIPMDCSNSPDGKLQPSLLKFYDALSKELEQEVEYSPSVQYLLEQGVLLMNTDLTVKLNKSGSHEGLWEPFQKYFLTEVMSSYTGIIYVLAGKNSERMEPYICARSNYIYKVEHPAAAEYAKRGWNSQGIFTLTNKILHENQGKYSHIYWDKKEWDEPVPF